MKKEIHQATEWMLDLQDPEIKLRDRTKFGPWFFGLEQFKGTSISSSISQGRISILQNKLAKNISQSKSTAQESISQKFSSTVYVQSESKSNFYLATILALKSTVLCSSFSAGTETDVTKVQQLIGAAKSFTESNCTPIYYVNYASAFTSQTYFFENTRSHLVYVQSKTISYSRLSAEPPHIFPKLLALTSRVVVQSDSLAKITRAFNIYSTAQSVPELSSQLTITRPLSSKDITATYNLADISISKSLNSKTLDNSKLAAIKAIKLGLHSELYSQTFLQGSEMLSRILAAKFSSQSLSKANISRQLNINSKMFSQSILKGGEIVTRVLNGVAESISIAQKSLGTVNRLFVSNIISISFSRATGGYINKHLYSAFYSQSFIYGNEVVVRPLAASSKSQNPFHANKDVLINAHSKCAEVTISSAQETNTKPLAGSGKSQNPFHTNPNILKQLQAKAQTETFAKENSISKVENLYSRTTSQTESNGQEIISRPLSSKSLSQTNLDADISVLRKLHSEIISQTESNSQDSIIKKLFSQLISQSTVKINISINKIISSQVFVDSKANSQSINKKIGVYAKSILQTEAQSQEVISRKLSSVALDQSKANANGFNTLVNIYGSAISDSSAKSNLLQKLISLHSEIIIQSYAGGTDNYLGNKQAEVTFAEPEVGQSVINLAPFNFLDQKDI